MEKKHIIWKRILEKTGKVLKVGFKTAVVLVALAVVVVVFLLVKYHYDEHLGKYAHNCDRVLSGDIGVHIFENETARVYNFRTREYTTPRLDWVSARPERDSLAVFSKDGKRGFVNVRTGKIAIEARYDHAWVFSEGLAAVVDGDKHGFINSDGEFVFETDFEFRNNHDYTFKHGVCCIEDENGKFGLLGRDGSWIIPTEYYYISYIPEADMFQLIKDDKHGLLKNGTFEWMLPLEYDNINWTDAPTGKGFIVFKDFCAKHIAVDGTVLNPFVVDETEVLKYITSYDSEGLYEYSISDKILAYEVDGLWGVLDSKTGRVVIPAMYGHIRLASDSIVECVLEKYGSYDCVLYDLEGHKID